MVSVRWSCKLQWVHIPHRPPKGTSKRSNEPGLKRLGRRTSDWLSFS
jgi:hypothetical protein